METMPLPAFPVMIPRCSKIFSTRYRIVSAKLFAKLVNVKLEMI